MLLVLRNDQPGMPVLGVQAEVHLPPGRLGCKKPEAVRSTELAGSGLPVSGPDGQLDAATLDRVMADRAWRQSDAAFLAQG
jgi:hypothetical protein